MDRPDPVALLPEQDRVLLQGRDQHDPLFLQLKEAPPRSWKVRERLTVVVGSAFRR